VKIDKNYSWLAEEVSCCMYHTCINSSFSPATSSFLPKGMLFSLALLKFFFFVIKESHEFHHLGAFSRIFFFFFFFWLYRFTHDNGSIYLFIYHFCVA
jgi:hypothetical protein